MKKSMIVIAVSLFLSACAVNQEDTFVAKAAAADATNIDIGSARDIYNGALFPDKAVRTYSNTDKIFPTRTIKAGN